MIDNSKELTDLKAVDEKLARLSWQILREPYNPRREEQLKELAHLKETARSLRNKQLH